MASEIELGTTFWFDLPLEQTDADELIVQSVRTTRQQEQGLEL